MGRLRETHKNPFRGKSHEQHRACHPTLAGLLPSLPLLSLLLLLHQIISLTFLHSLLMQPLLHLLRTLSLLPSQSYFIVFRIIKMPFCKQKRFSQQLLTINFGNFCGVYICTAILEVLTTSHVLYTFILSPSPLAFVVSML